MADLTTEDDPVVNARVPAAVRTALDRACVVDGLPRYKLAEVVRIVLRRAIAAKMHERLDVDAGEEAAS